MKTKELKALRLIMRRGPAAVLLAIVGYVAGYFAGAFYGCSGPDPSNLCGLWGAFIIGP
jgi:hypothetical protein